MSIKRPIEFSSTTIVIGAGAHIPYGFPGSNNLTEEIKSLYVDDDSPVGQIIGVQRDRAEICKLIKELEILPVPKDSDSSIHDKAIKEALDKFLIAFAGAQVDSIDTYLAPLKIKRNSATIKIGKLLIAYFIRKYEKRRVGFHKKRDWIQYLINEFLKHDQHRDAFFKNPPGIYTFNYDTLLERSLLAHLVYHHQVEITEAREMVNSLGIVHIYGDIGSFEKGAKKKSGVEFFGQAIDRIKVVGEERAANQNEVIANKLNGQLHRTEKVYFLGFRFDSLNTEVLFQHDPQRRWPFDDVGFYSTHVDLEEHERSEILERLPFSLTFPGHPNCTCYDLIRKHQPIFVRDADGTGEILSDFDPYDDGGGSEDGWMSR